LRGIDPAVGESLLKLIATLQQRTLPPFALPVLLPIVLVAWLAPAMAQDTPIPATFDAFLQELWPDAQAKGVARATFDKAFAGLTPDPRVIAATRRQPEYGKPVGDYVNAIASKARIEAGKGKASEWAKTLAAVEQKYEVDRFILLGLWGIETSFGAEKDHWDIVRSLATLAQARYRHPYFRNELIVALQIMQDRHVARDKLIGSWAGAMGQPQFMPSDYVEYAVNFSGNGAGDIWNSVPDVLASIGNYLHKEQWKPGLPWGFEVTLPKDFDYRKSRGSFSQWAALGVKRADGAALAGEAGGIMFFPSGAAGPAFLVTENFVVIKRYNNSDVYALAVAELADRVRGMGPIRAAWPANDRQLTREERIALQRRLAELGYKVKEFEGHIDFDLRDAIRDVQAKLGMVPDGSPTPGLLARLAELKP
jgi:lytic murein transglycosylase